MPALYCYLQISALCFRQIHLYAHENEGASAVQIVFAGGTGNVVGVIADSGADANVADHDVAILVELQRIDYALIAFPGVVHVFGVQIAEPDRLGNGMDKQR